jgi:hypothetical protein
MRTRTKKGVIRIATYLQKNNLNIVPVTTNRLQENLLEKLEEEFPSSMRIFFKEVCNKSTFLKKGFEEKKEIFL